MEKQSFYGLAKEIADGTISRGQALKLVGGALLGAFGLADLPDLAEAKKKKKKKKKKKHRHAGGVIPPSPPLPGPPSPAPPPTRPPLCTPGQKGCPISCTCKGTCQQLPSGQSICVPPKPAP